MVKAKWAAGIGLRRCLKGPNSMVSHGARARAEDGERGGFAGRMLVVVVVVVLSLPSSRVVSALPSAFTVTHTHAHAHAQRGRTQEEKQTQPVTPVKKVDKAPDMQDAFRRLRVHELDGSPLRRSNQGVSSFSNYSNGPVEAARLTPSLSRSLCLCIPLRALLWGRSAGTAQANGDGPLV